MAVRELPRPRWGLPKNNGAPAVGWKVHTREPGTLNAKNTYNASDGLVANTNPIILDARGEADIWWDGKYDLRVEDETGALQFTIPNYGSGDPVPLAQQSLVGNYSFETASTAANAPDNWTISLYGNGTQSLDLSAGNQFHGAKALKFVSSGQGGGFATTDLFPIQEALVLDVAVAMKSTVQNVRNLVEVLYYDRAGVLLTTDVVYDNSATNPTAWTDKLFASLPPANSRFAKLRVTGGHSSVATVGNTWFDNVRVNQRILDVPYVIDRVMTTVDIVNSAVETDLYTFNVPAGWMRTNRKLRLTMFYDYLNNTGAAHSFTIYTKWGGVTVGTMAGFSSNASNPARRGGRVVLEVDNLNAANAQMAVTHISHGFGGNQYNPAYDSVSAGYGQMHAWQDGLTSDTAAAAVAITIRAIHDAASANLSIRRRSAVLELV